jgi:hypothetical protein
MKRCVVWIVAVVLVCIASGCKKMPVRGDLVIEMTAIRLDGVPYPSLTTGTYEGTGGSVLEIDYTYTSESAIERFWHGDEAIDSFDAYVVEPGVVGSTSGTISVAIPIEDYVPDNEALILQQRRWRVYGITEDGVTAFHNISIRKNE